MIFVSCEGELDILPGENEVIQPDFENIDDIELALNGVYSGFKSDRLYTANAIALGEWTADNLKIAPENVGFGAIIHEWDYTESDQVLEATWIGIYDIVRRANFVIEGARAFTGTGAEEAQRFLAQALVLRSFALLEAHRLYGLPYQNGSELSVVYVTDPSDILQQNPRITTSELFGLIRADLNEAMPNLPSDIDKNFVSSSFAYGLLARMAAEERDWDAVVSNSDLAIQSSASSLSTLQDYSMMWGENDEDGEAIFKLALDSDDTKIGDLYYNDGVGPVFDPSDDIYDLYSDEDIRKENFYLSIPEFDLIISKFYGPPSNRGLHEPFIMRLSEMYLLRAEANAELGNASAALNDLDAIRSNRISNFVSPMETGSVLIDAIRIERRKELAYEGFRFSDLKRWGEAVERKDCTSDECELEAGDFKFTFAIPRAELFANDNIIQNPGY